MLSPIGKEQSFTEIDPAEHVVFTLEKLRTYSPSLVRKIPPMIEPVINEPPIDEYDLRIKAAREYPAVAASDIYEVEAIQGEKLVRGTITDLT